MQFAVRKVSIGADQALQFYDYVGQDTNAQSLPNNCSNDVVQSFAVTYANVQIRLSTTILQTVSTDQNGNVTGQAVVIVK